MVTNRATTNTWYSQAFHRGCNFHKKFLRVYIIFGKCYAEQKRDAKASVAGGSGIKNRNASTHMQVRNSVNSWTQLRMCAWEKASRTVLTKSTIDTPITSNFGQHKFCLKFGITSDTKFNGRGWHFGTTNSENIIVPQNVNGVKLSRHGFNINKMYTIGNLSRRDFWQFLAFS